MYTILTTLKLNKKPENTQEKVGKAPVRRQNPAT
jgi:hypothetical protein